mmetsp:Transcript_4741/g.9936  ORF Transcript_4741/g.9936 Transcript_4741/m.9936 type:complete len:333 (-) Transcript_4741:708-1706(-)
MAEPPSFTVKAAAFFGLTGLQIAIGVFSRLVLFQKGASASIARAVAVATLGEFFKLVASCAIVTRKEKSNVLNFYRENINSSVLRAAAGLAFVYAINNVLVLSMYSIADPSVVVLVRTTAGFFTGGILYIFKMKELNAVHGIATFIQVSGLIVNQYDECNTTTSSPVQVYLLSLLSALMSAGAAVFNQSYVKKQNSNIHVLNSSLYFFGVAMGGVVFLLLPMVDSVGLANFELRAQDVFLSLVQAAVGIATAFVYYYLDALTKTFANGLSTVAMVVISIAFFGLEARLISSIGALLVIVSAFLYFIVAENALKESGDKPPPKTSAADSNNRV